MKRRSVGLLVASAVVLAGVSAVPAEAHGSDKRVVGYYTNWSGYARNFLVSYLVKNGSAARLTQINYAFGFVDAQGNCVSSDPWADYQRPFTAEQSTGAAGLLGDVERRALFRVLAVAEQHEPLHRQAEAARQSLFHRREEAGDGTVVI